MSKWEVEGCYPDLELLAPIANFFNITIDELMGFDKLKEQEEIDGYLRRHHDTLFAGDAKKTVAIMREANAKYPGKFELMKELAKILYVYANSSPEAEPNEEDKQNAFKEVISLGEKIRSECKDDKIRRELLRIICVSYRKIGESEKALKIAYDNFITNIYESDMVVITDLLDGDKLIEQQQTNMVEMMHNSCMIMCDLSKDFAPEDRLIIYKSILDMYFTIFKNGDFHFYDLYIPFYYIEIVKAYMELKDYKNALENLKNAADHTIASDQINYNTPYTSPMVNKMQSPSNGRPYIAGLKGNQAYYFLKGFDDERKGLGDEKYNPIRDTPEFKEIRENLEKHAVENIYL